MARYKITFTRYTTYGVEAENEDNALDKAYSEFISDMRSSVAITFYDEVEVKEIEEE